jgi:hypothetical protein
MMGIGAMFYHQPFHSGAVPKKQISLHGSCIVTIKGKVMLNVISHPMPHLIKQA